MYGALSYVNRLTPMVRGLLIATVGVFALQVLSGMLLGGDVLTELFGLSGEGLRHAYIWQPVTYIFLHGGLLHLVLNMLVLAFMGPHVERAIGPRHVLALYLLSGALGGIGWLLLTPVSWIPCVGASGSIFGVLAAFAALFPRQPITLLVLFVFPVSMPAWQMVLLLGGAEMLSLLTARHSSIAYAAHLAGGLSGFIYARTISRGWPQMGFMFRRGRGPTPTWPVPDHREVDRILDKIAARGMASLTREERALLEQRARRGR